MTKFLAALAVFTAIATPAFAQSFCTCDGTGNVLKFANNPITYQNHAPAIAATNQGAPNAFAMAPRRVPGRRHGSLE
ncbi:MAG TPA: hypothetical protein VHQ92_04330 [Pseudolabrys sp.]|jgi:hypothetical protein|nr:hypothetical protein [Pseudolabrys sp.]